MLNVTATPVRAQGHTSCVSGKPSNFTAEQLQALRRALRDYHARQTARESQWSQGRTGDAIGVSQQVAGRLLGKEMAGLALPTAQAIVRLEGFQSLDEFFAAHEPSAVNPANQPGHRDLAITLARRAGLADAAVRNVLDRYVSSQFHNRPVKWWLAKFVAEDDDLDLGIGSPSSMPPPPTADASTKKPEAQPATPKRQKAG